MSELEQSKWGDLRVAFLLPHISPGSGGIQTICRYVTYLQSLGAKCTVIVISELMDSEHHYLRLLNESYDCKPDAFYLTPFCDENFDIVVATYYETVYYLPFFEGAKSCYFVQDRESTFFPAGDARNEVDQTYSLGIPTITIGRWLAQELKTEYGARALPIDFSADERIYRPLDCNREHAVCAIYQPEKPRRCSRLVEDTFRLIHMIDPEVKLVLFGSGAEPHLDFPVEFRGVLTKEECNNLYNTCSVGLCISSSNPSRIPYEMMAAGLPAVDVHQTNTLYDLSQDCVLLADPNPPSLAAAVLRLLGDDKLNRMLSSAGKTFMEKRVHDAEERMFADALYDVYSEKTDDVVQDWQRLYNKGPFDSVKEIRELYMLSRKDKLIGRINPPAFECGKRYLTMGIADVSDDVDRGTLRCQVWPPFGHHGDRWYEFKRDGHGRYTAQVDFSDFDYCQDLFRCVIYAKIAGIDTELLVFTVRTSFDQNDCEQDSGGIFVPGDAVTVHCSVTSEPIVIREPLRKTAYSLARRVYRRIRPR